MTAINRINSIPQTLGAVITLGRNVFAGANSFGAEAGLSQNSPDKIGADLHDVIGNPATPLIPGKLARYDAQLVAVKEAHAAKRAAIKAGREFCRLAINLLRPVLGNEWNTAWQAAGFHLPTLRLPSQPAAMLTALRAYYDAHPARENALAGITAASAAAAANAVDAAILAASTAKGLRVTYKKQRDEALTKLRKRLSGTRAELDQLLADDDGRWYKFGFRRPADGKLPALVETVTLTAAAPDVVLASWPHSARAETYRVTWRRSEDESSATTGTIVSDTQVALTGLPSGAEIIVGVTARNRSGETTIAETSIMVT